MLTCSVALLVIGFCETLIFAVVDDGLHRSPSFLGVLMAAQGVGAIVEGTTAAAVIRRVGEQRAAAFGFLLFALGDVFLVSGNLPAVLGGLVVAGLPWLLVALYTLIQRRTPNHLMGRVGTTTASCCS
ncbi:MAG: hypothetical protein GEV10_08385 [Streptosporangiales bacterium]|nr:hypothetical protein [Streptosporangiales bacterium]